MNEKELIKELFDLNNCVQEPQDYNFEDGISYKYMIIPTDEEGPDIPEIMTEHDDKLSDYEIVYQTFEYPEHCSYVIYEPVFENQEGGPVCYYTKSSISEENILNTIKTYRKANFEQYLVCYKLNAKDVNNKDNWTQIDFKNL